MEERFARQILCNTHEVQKCRICRVVKKEMGISDEQVVATTPNSAEECLATYHQHHSMDGRNPKASPSCHCTQILVHHRMKFLYWHISTKRSGCRIIATFPLPRPPASYPIPVLKMRILFSFKCRFHIKCEVCNSQQRWKLIGNAEIGSIEGVGNDGAHGGICGI